MAQLQRQWSAYAAFLLQSGGLGVPAAGAGANYITLSGGTGNITQQSISSILVRQDGMSLIGRGGTFASAGQYPGELNMGNYDGRLSGPKPVEILVRGDLVPPERLSSVVRRFPH
jgi:hypothetical protein